MATKKETTSKKTSSKKSTAPKKQVTQVNKKTKVSEEQIEKIVTNIEEPKVPNVDIEKFATENGDYDLTKATYEEVIDVINHLEPDDVVEVVKTEVVNGDPSVLMPKEEKVTEEKVEKKKEEIKKTKNNMTEKLNKYFNYFWNGQAIDY
jgi:hypothetical protein